jgi:antitoxin HigA-1
MFKRAVHPGVILKDELKELGVSPTEFARQIDVPPNRVSQIITGKRSITGDTALRFGHWFGVDPQFWINLQAQFELAVADKETGADIRQLPTKDSLAQQPEQPRLV